MASKTLNSIKRKCEHISSYESGLDDGLKDDLKFIISKTEALIRELKGKGAEEALVALASDFKRGVSQDLEDLISFKRLNKKLRDALENVEKLEIRRRKAEERAFSICREYFEKSEDYTRVKNIAKAATREKIEKIRQEYVEKISSIVRGYDISISGKEVSVEQLFQVISQRPEWIVDIDLSKKSRLLNFFNEDEGKAKLSVVKYTSKAATRNIRLAYMREGEEMDRIESQFLGVRQLGEECKKTDEVRKSIEAKKEEALSVVEEIKKSNLFKYAGRDKILKMKQRYLDALNLIS